MGFMEGHIEEERVFHGKVFPKTLLPTKNGKNLAESVKEKEVWLSELLRDHGALLFRGFDIGSAEDFSAVVEAFGRVEFDGDFGRTKMAERVYTATAAPLHLTIPFHHEMALIRKFPQRVFLYCLEPAPEGGQTSIIPSSVIVEKLEEKLPQVVQKFETDGVKITLHIEAAFWQPMLKTQDQGEAEKRAFEMFACDSVQFNIDGSADLIFGPKSPIIEYNGKRVLFYSILAYETKVRSTYITFSDGSPLPLHATETCNTIMEENCVDINWQKGDILLVDNIGVQHARRPGKPPRTVLVSLSH